MFLVFSYNPLLFYSIVVVFALIICPVVAILSRNKKLEKFLLPTLFLHISAPFIAGMVMIYTSGSSSLIADFWTRLFIFKIGVNYLLFIILLMPCSIFLGTTLSLFFGYSREQFYIAKEFSVMRGQDFLGVAIPVLLAPMLEELGWRGYGVDSLRAYFGLLNASLLFGLLWGLWHIPGFFVKGFYQNELWKSGVIYVVNFFVSILVVAILMNWVYYKTGRSIPALVLFHSILNLSSIAFRTHRDTKCITTGVLFFVAATIIFCDKVYFF